MANDVRQRMQLLRLTPRPHVVRNAALSLVLISLPVFGVLLFLGIRNGAWMYAVCGQALAFIFCGLGYILFSRAYIEVTPTTIDERGFLGVMTSVPRSRIASVVLARTTSAGSTETSPQLVVRGTSGERLLRMRGAFWPIETMRSVIAALDIVPTIPPEPMTPAEFFSRYPGTAFWYERGRLLSGLLVGLLALVGLVLVLVILHLVGLPLVG